MILLTMVRLGISKIVVSTHIPVYFYICFPGEHTTPEFAKKNPYKKVPVIVDDGFAMSER